MQHRSATDIAERVKQIQHDNEWPEVWDIRDALNATEQDELLRALFDQLQVMDYDDEKQTRVLDLMLTTDHMQALPYLRAMLQIATRPIVKCHLCWILEGNADTSCIDGLGHLALSDPDPLVRSCALIALSFIHDTRIIPILQHVAANDEGICNGQRVGDVAQKILQQQPGAEVRVGSAEHGAGADTCQRGSFSCNGATRPAQRATTDVVACRSTWALARLTQSDTMSSVA